MNACVLTIGDELLQGFTIDTNSSWLGNILLPYNILIKKKITVEDNIDAIIHESKCILKDNYDFLFVTGGLGPTHDDITKEAFRQLLKDKLIFDEKYFSELKKRFKKHLIKIPESNRSQAMILTKAETIPNENGSARGIYFKRNNTQTFIMPGVPKEMKEMVIKYIIPNYLKTIRQEKSITIRTAGIMESQLAEKVKILIEKYSIFFRFAFLPHYNGVSFRITKLAEESNLKNVEKEFFQAMQPYAYGINNDTLEKILGKELIHRNLTIAVAESCTGGLIGKRLTDTAGSSDYFLGSIVSYSNELKTSFLNISKRNLNTHGSVSRQIALEMAQRIRNKTKADIGLSTTGISGPGGGTKTKPVGLVYIGLVTPVKTIVKKYNFYYGRHIHREMTTTAALNITRLSLEN